MSENDAVDLVETITTTDPTPTLPEPSEEATRYLGLIYGHDRITPLHRPLVLATLEEAHRLLAAVVAGDSIRIREMQSGTITERTETFVGGGEPELVLWRVPTSFDPSFDEEYPHLHVKVGPRGGIFHEPA